MSAIGPFVSRAANYEYADSALQDLSASQKMLVRMGPENGVKAKLRELKRALTRGM